MRGRELGGVEVLPGLSDFLRLLLDGRKDIEGEVVVQHSKLGLF